MNTAWIKALAAGMLLASAAVGGWTARGWKDGSEQRDAVQAKADAAARQYLMLNASNQDTAKRMAALLTAMEGQANAFAKLDTYLAAHPMGTCRFAAATDGLWSGAYDAAFGTHQAGSGHAPAQPAAPAAQPHEPAHR